MSGTDRRTFLKLMGTGAAAFTVTVASDDGFAYRVAGHVEDGRASATDPAMGGLVGRHP